MKRFSISRTLSLILVSLIAISSVGTTLPADWLKRRAQQAKQVAGSASGALRGGVEKLSSAASGKITSGLSSAYDRVRRMGPAAVVSQLQNQVENLGNKVGYMGNCMVKGTCSNAERAAFIGTSVTVLALTAAVVGVTLSVAATSKEVDSVTKATTQEVKGWGPEQIFQRLNNTVTNFKRSLASLKEGMLKKQLTRGQKKFLYGTALSISALVTLAVGVGVASYVYAEKRQAARPEVDLSDLEIEAPAAPPVQAPTPEPQPVAPSKAAQILDEGKGILLKFKTALEPDVAKTAFQQFFRRNFALAKDNAQQLSAAIQETVQKGQDKFFESKDAAADFFLNKVGLGDLKSDLSDFSVKEMVQKLLNIDFGAFFEGIRDAASQVTSLREQADALLARAESTRQLSKQFDDLKDYIEDVTKNRIETLKTSAKRYKIDFAVALAALLAHKNPRVPMAKKIKLELQEALKIYPELVEIVNNKLNLPLIGVIIEKLINATVGGALNIAILTNQLAGKLGGVVSSTAMVRELKALKEHVATLGANIKEALSNKVFAVEQPSTKKTIKAFIKNFSAKGLSTARDLKTHINPILEQAKIAKPYIDKIKKGLDAYVKKASDAIESIKTAAGEVKKNPLSAIPRFPRLLRDQVEQVTGLTKGALMQTLTDSTEMLSQMKLNDVVADAFKGFEVVNELLKVDVDGKKASLINEDFVEELRKIILFSYVNINESIRNLNAIIRQEPSIAAPAA